MRTRVRALAFAVGLAGVLAVPAAAYADEPAGGPYTDEASISVQNYDELGNFLFEETLYPSSTNQPTDPAQTDLTTCQISGSPGGGGGGGGTAAFRVNRAAATDAGGGGGIVCADATGGFASLTRSASGCKSMTVTVRRYSVLHTLEFSFYQYKSWCWKNHKVTGPNLSGSPVFYGDLSNSDGFHYRRSVSPYSYFYAYGSYGPNSGHYSHLGYEVETCVASKGCLFIEYPYLNIYVTGDGTWSYNWYDGD